MKLVAYIDQTIVCTGIIAVEIPDSYRDKSVPVIRKAVNAAAKKAIENREPVLWLDGEDEHGPEPNGNYYYPEEC